MLKVDKISKRYKDKIAVDQISFEIDKGHICGFVGPNGAGKSTTMNIITGYLQATSGTVSIDGLDINTQPMEYRRSFGYLPEQPPLYPDMIVEDYLNFVYDAKGLVHRERKKQVEEVMEMTQISHVRGRLIRNLSKGYRQRVGMSQAFLGKPSLIILDEPTIGLDPAQIVQVRNIMINLREKHTVLLSSHILSEIAEVCDEIVLINNGKLIAAGTEKELLENNTGEACYIIRVYEKSLGNVQNVLTGSIPGLKIEKKGQDAFICFCEAKNEMGGRLLDVLISHGIKIKEFYRKKDKLEDVFLRLVSK